MINKISFMGKVFLAGNVERLSQSHQDEVEEIQRFSDDNDCDVFVYNRGYYADGTGAYDTIVVKPDSSMGSKFSTGQNMFAKKIFDFKHPNRGKKANLNFKYKFDFRG